MLIYKFVFVRLMDRRKSRVKVKEGTCSRKPLQYDNVLLDPDGPVTGEDYFPFTALPVDCKLKVFSYLNHLEKGSLLSVCKSWYGLLLHSTLWCHLSILNVRFVHHMKAERITH